MRVNWKGILQAIWRHWKDTLGSLFALILAWNVMLKKVSYEEAVAVLIILWVGRFVNRKLDPFAAFKKEDNNNG